jgi:outer membrane PBP1 activator LpoA protein
MSLPDFHVSRLCRLPGQPASATRRRSLHFFAGALGAAVLARPFSALAQDASTGTDPADLGTPSDRPQRIGSGPTQIGLLVPPANGVYGRAAAALIDGVRAAQSQDGADFTVEVIEAGESGNYLNALCASLRDRGFALALGPLTRNAVNALALTGPLPLPVLALNQTSGVAPPDNMIVFGLSIESEAEQVASYAFGDVSARGSNRPPRAGIVDDGSPLSQRSVAAFIHRWYELGGEYFEPVETSSASPAALRALLAGVQADIYFAAIPPDTAIALRAAIGDQGLIYGTSALNSGAVPEAAEQGEQIRSPELDGVRIIAMPWQMKPDDPLVMSYARPKNLNVELQKLYALGIDSFRIGKRLLTGETRIDMDGVTGRLHLDLALDPRVTRQPLLAEYRNGVLNALPPR